MRLYVLLLIVEAILLIPNENIVNYENNALAKKKSEIERMPTLKKDDTEN